MSGYAFGITRSMFCTLGLALVLATGLTGCKSDKSKTTAQAPVVDSGSGGGSSGGTSGGVTPPAPVENRAPTLSGVAVTTAKTTQPFTYQPVAIDADGDRLTFDVQNKPEWIAFDPATGRIDGTPPAAVAGSTAVMQIVVSYGKASASMDLSISVLAPVMGAATLAWQAPKTNADGTPLDDLVGYVIRYGQATDALTQTIRIGDPRITSAMVENLPEGVWYFTLSAVNEHGIESDPAGMLAKTIG